jgi:hypothetical protein
MAVAVSGQYNLGPVKALTESAAYVLGPMFDIKTIYGWRQSDPYPDHPTGHALDFMVYSDTAKGDALAAYAIEHADELGIKYIVWNRRSWNAKRGTWQTYTGSTNPHTDHVHITFNDTNSAGLTTISGLAGGLGFGETIGIPGSDLTIPNPFAADASVADMLRPFGIAGVNIVSPAFWRRVGTGALGVGLVVVGVIFLNKRSITETGRAVAGFVGGIGSTAIQGAAFGFGAGKAGGIGPTAPTTGVPSKPPPRPPSMRPISGTPVTSVLPEAYAPVSPGGTYTVTGVAKNPTEYRPPKGKSLLETAKGRKGSSTGKKKTKTASKPFVSSPLRQGPYGGE